MAVSVSTDLSVNVTTDVNADKLADKRRALSESIRKGETKAYGVSQVTLGLLVMSFSLPLLFTEFTEVVSCGVPWWSSLTFIVAGITAIVLEKHTSMKWLSVCMVVTLVAALVSFLAFIFYTIDLHNNPETSCNSHGDFTVYEESRCEQHFTTMLSYGVKSSLLFFTMIQVVISSTLSYILFKKRRGYGQYTSLDQNVSSTFNDQFT